LETFGDGGVVAYPIVQDFWVRKNAINMRNFAKLCHCIIKFIEKEELAVGVGVGENSPYVRCLENGADIDLPPTPEEFHLFDDCYESYSKEFQTILGPNYFALKQSTKEFKQHFQIDP
jgi:hypothetical protein